MKEEAMDTRYRERGYSVELVEEDHGAYLKISRNGRIVGEVALESFLAGLMRPFRSQSSGFDRMNYRTLRSMRTLRKTANDKTPRNRGEERVAIRTLIRVAQVA
jgi:hypothetical protein